MEKPMTTSEFFMKVCNVLQEEGCLPEILDYHLPDNSPVEIKTDEFRIINNLYYSGSEGIYLDVGINFQETDLERVHWLGTFKTLEDNPSAMRIMGTLLADFIVCANTYVCSHAADFIWTGFRVCAIGDDGLAKQTMYCKTEEAAWNAGADFLIRNPAVKIRNNVTRREVVWKKDENGNMTPAPQFM